MWKVYEIQIFNGHKQWFREHNHTHLLTYCPEGLVHNRAESSSCTGRLKYLLSGSLKKSLPTPETVFFGKILVKRDERQESSSRAKLGVWECFYCYIFFNRGDMSRFVSQEVVNEGESFENIKTIIYGLLILLHMSYSFSLYLVSLSQALFRDFWRRPFQSSLKITT